MQTETRLPLWLRVLEWLAWSALMAVACAFLALRYWVLPHIEDYREQIVAAISRSIGLQVKIGTIEANWQGLRPQLSFTDLRIYDRAGRVALVLPAVENVVSWRSLLYLDLRLRSLTVEAPKLTVRRDAAGAIYIAGMQLAGAGPAGGFGDWVLGQREIVVHNAEIEWRDEMRGAPSLELHALDFRLRSAGDRHAMGLSARPPEALGADLELRAELIGRSVADLAAWNGRVYAEIGNTDLAGWRAWIDYPVDLQRGQGALRLWATLGAGKLLQGTVDVALTGVAVRLAADLPLLELQSLRGRLQTRVKEQGYEISANNLALSGAAGLTLHPTSFSVAWSPRSAQVPEHGSASANLVELEPLAQLAAFLPFPAKLRELLEQLAPRGNLLDLAFSWNGPLPEADQFRVRSRFARVAVNAWNKVPGFAGLSGSLDASGEQGRIYLASRATELSLPKVFPEPRIRFDELSGQIDWQRAKTGAIDVRLSALNFSNPHLAGSASGTYTWRDDSGPGTIDLSARLSRADGSQVVRYLPLASIMGEAPRTWLAAAIVSGQASDVTLRLKGDLRDFPFVDPASGQFQVGAHVSKGTLQVGPKWPRIEDIDGELLFERDKMTIVGHSASVYGARLSDVRVGISSLTAPQHLLLIAGTAEGPSGAFLAFIAGSPVRGMVGGLTDAMRASGRGSLTLKLELPLGKPEATKVAGEFRFAGNSLTLMPQLPPIEQAGGTVSFSESGVTVHDVQGRFLGGPVRINGGSAPGAGVRVVARGQVELGGLRALAAPRWGGLLSGAAAYVATASVRNGNVQLRLESSLRDVASALPPPLDKAAGKALPLKLELLPGTADARDRISLTLGDRLAAEILRQRSGAQMAVQRASIALGPRHGAALRIPERPGVLLYGSTPSLDLDRWLALFPGGGSAGGPVSVDLRLDTLDAFGKRVTGVTLKGGADAEGWSANVQADQLAGDLAYRGAGNGKLIARLARFTIPGDTPGQEAAGKGEHDIKDLPALDLVADRFAFRGKQLGRVEVAAQHVGEDWRIERLAMVNPDASMTGSGTWHGGPASSTELKFELKANDAGKFLDRIGYKDLVKGGKATLGGTLNWNDGPLSIDYPSLAGELTLSAKDGQFLEIEPGIGKLVSLMSLQMLPRRITLDFRDVFSKGFQFDSIGGTLQIRQGVMTTKDFKMHGAAADVSMNGQTDLAQETQDLTVRVVPGLGDSASTVIGLLHPLIGVASAIAQRILKNPLGQIFSYDYKITGTWSDPNVEKLKPPANPTVGGY
ncbi:MAG TPA: YhdP family protein [Burkholderiales bacterium]|nr:YhdP family protein [Burkholderiales bacterium]